MKKAIFSLVFILAAAFAMNAQNEVVTGPSIQLDKEVHDYGEIDKGGDTNCEFTVTNTGTEALIISKCKGSCGCTVPKCDNTPIAPGETSAIKVKYDNTRVGPINKSVTITSNAVNEPTKVVRIKGKINDTAAGGAPVKKSSAGAPVNK
ncbi:MAG: DUF1573 domain-containing protein [Flavobacteriales bacterium]